MVQQGARDVGQAQQHQREQRAVHNPYPKQDGARIALAQAALQQRHQPPGQAHTNGQNGQLHQHRGAEKGLHPQAHVVEHRHVHRAVPQRFQAG